MDFLSEYEDFECLPWDPDSKAFEGVGRFQGNGNLGLQVCVAKCGSRPSAAELRKVWKAREGGKGFPLLLIVFYESAGLETAVVCGPEGDNPPVNYDVNPDVVERLCAAALKKPDRISALMFLTATDIEEQSKLPGVVNAGLFATNELVNGVPSRADWDAMCSTGSYLRGKESQALLENLGFEVKTETLGTSILSESGSQKAVAVFLDETDLFEAPNQKFERQSPVMFGLAAADRLEIDWLVIVRGSTMRLYSSDPNTGVGRRGRSSTFLEVNIDLVSDEQVGIVPLCFSPAALDEDGTVSEILLSSEEFVVGLGERLRDRIYFDAVPGLATVLADKHGDSSTEGLREAYAQTMSVLFRLLFLAYGEDKDLLPYRSNGTYAEHSLTRLAKQLTDQEEQETGFDTNGTDLWDDIQVLWLAIENGRHEWDVPAYGGTLFSSDPEINSSGAALAGYRFTNAEFGPTLEALLVDVDGDGIRGPVDFRSLSVREFGTIYEGLLESELTTTPYDLTENNKGEYVRAEDGDAVVVAAGGVWFHNTSGERKSSGSYFTKSFAVEHLLDYALKPALDDHLKEVKDLLDKNNDAGARNKLFSFRSSDLSMGSGHFLVAAIDYIEVAFSNFLAENTINHVNNEIAELRDASKIALGELADRYEFDSTQILRRLIARRCIYGCDLNPISVELARLGIWIHTFVPGLPLSFLDHNLIVGNSLTGIGTLSEIDQYLPDGNLASSMIQEKFKEVLPILERVATINDSNIKDIEIARTATQEAIIALQPLKRILDLIVLDRSELINIDPFILSDEKRTEELHSEKSTQELLGEMKPLHFPFQFPEIFGIPNNPGFACILGNPPWDKVHVEEHSWWGRHLPGVRGLPVKEMNTKISLFRKENPALNTEYEKKVEYAKALSKVLLRGPYPGISKSHPDLYKAFSWRNWMLCKEQGVIANVLPRQSTASAGMSLWRETVLEHGDFIEVCSLNNKGNWVFDDVSSQYTINLVSIKKTGHPDDEVCLNGPYSSYFEYVKGKQEPIVKLPTKWIKECFPGLSLPQVSNQSELKVLKKFADHEQIFSKINPWDFKPVQGDFNSTTGKKYFTTGDPQDTNLWKVYGGKAINSWNPETGKYYMFAEPEVVKKVLNEKHEKHTDIYGTLPYEKARIVWRRIARSKDMRTVIASLIPSETITQDTAPFLTNKLDDVIHEAYLLGVLNSCILDWFARRFVELHVNFFILECFTVPNPSISEKKFQRVVNISGRLAAVDNRFASWAEKVGVPVGSVKSQTEKENLLAELDAVVAHLYGLNTDDLKVIWDTFHTTVDHLPDLDAVLDHFERWT